jgi:hypothetical protein
MYIYSQLILPRYKIELDNPPFQVKQGRIFTLILISLRIIHACSLAVSKVCHGLPISTSGAAEKWRRVLEDWRLIDEFRAKEQRQLEWLAPL